MRARNCGSVLDGSCVVCGRVPGSTVVVVVAGTVVTVVEVLGVVAAGATAVLDLGRRAPAGSEAGRPPPPHEHMRRPAIAAPATSTADRRPGVGPRPGPDTALLDRVLLKPITPRSLSARPVEHQAGGVHSARYMASKVSVQRSWTTARVTFTEVPRLSVGSPPRHPVRTARDFRLCYHKRRQGRVGA